MKKIAIIIVAVLVTTLSVSAQNINTAIKTEALKMARALSTMDLETYSTFMYPALVSDNSSKEKIKQ